MPSRRLARCPLAVTKLNHRHAGQGCSHVSKVRYAICNSKALSASQQIQAIAYTFILRHQHTTKQFLSSTRRILNIPLQGDFFNCCCKVGREMEAQGFVAQAIERVASAIRITIILVTITSPTRMRRQTRNEKLAFPHFWLCKLWF